MKNILHGMYLGRRKSGIPLVGDLPWGSHFCELYQTSEDLFEILGPFLKTGLENNELCLGITGSAEIENIWRKGLPFFNKNSGIGQIEILSYEECRAAGKDFSKIIVSMLDKAIFKGFDGLRLACDSLPSGNNGNGIISQISDSLGRYNILSFFAYPRNDLDALKLMNVVKKHRFALVKNAGKWEIIESSEARIAKDAVQRSEEKLHSVFNNMSEGFAWHRIVLDDNGKPCDYIFLEINEAFERLTGLSRGNIIGKRATQVLPAGIDLKDWISKYGVVAETGKSMHFDSFLEPLQKWLSISTFSPHEGYFAVTFDDITERKRSEERLKQTSERFALLAETAGALLVAESPQTVVERLCRKLMEYIGCDVFINFLADEESGKLKLNAYAGIPENNAKEIEWLDYGTAICGCAARDQKRIIAEDIFNTPDERTDLVKSYGVQAYCCHPLKAGTRIIGTLSFGSRSSAYFNDDQIALMKAVADQVAVAMDRILNEQAILAARDKLEGRVRERTAELDTKNIELHQRAEQLSRLASELSLAEQRERHRLALLLHDHLQQLLVGAKFGLELLNRQVKNTKQKESIQDISGLLKQSIEASRSLTVELSPPILHEAGLTAGLKWLSRWMEEKHGLTVNFQSRGNIAVDREDVKLLLFQSVRELLLNIIKHAEVSTAMVNIFLSGKNEVIINVSDDGKGFDPEKLQQGTGEFAGFGLFSIRERLTLLGGKFKIESAPGQGARFCLSAPVSYNPESSDNNESSKMIKDLESEEPKTFDTSKKIRLLIVDDHAVVRQGLCSFLESETDIEIIGQAADGKQALEITRDLRPDVVLMDINMPGMNGIEATKAINSESKNIKVIGLSMYDEADRASDMLEAGAAAYVSKSGELDDLLKEIRSAYKSRKKKK